MRGLGGVTFTAATRVNKNYIGDWETVMFRVERLAAPEVKERESIRRK